MSNAEDTKDAWKRLKWDDCPYTPNQAYSQIQEYRDYVTGFALHNEYPKPHKFFQIRIVNQTPLVTSTTSMNWWDSPQFMDKIFWAFQKPVSDRIDNDFYTYYALEPVECARVYLKLMETGKPLKSSMNGFVVPCDCCVLAWTETSAGISDHLHPDPEKVVTQEELDAKRKLDEDALKILDESWSVGADDESFRVTEKVRDNIRARLSRPS